MRITNKENSVRSFFNLYSDQFRELKEPEDKKDNLLTVQDVIDINTEMALCKSHVNFTYANTTETQASAQFANRDVNVSKRNIEKAINDASISEHAFDNNGKFNVASKIIYSMISDPIFTYQNDTTALSAGLYYLYKNEIKLDMPNDIMNGFLKDIKEDVSSSVNCKSTISYMEYMLESYVCDLDKSNEDNDRDLPGDVLE